MRKDARVIPISPGAQPNDLGAGSYNSSLDGTRDEPSA